MLLRQPSWMVPGRVSACVDCGFIEMAVTESLSTQLLQVLSIPSVWKPCLLKSLEPKFQSFLYGYNMSVQEALAIGLVQAAAIAEMIGEEWMHRITQDLGLNPRELPKGEAVFAEEVANTHIEQCGVAYQKVCEMEGLPIEALLKQVSDTYKLRIRRYTLQHHYQVLSDQFLPNSDKYLSIYLLQYLQHTALLIPAKYVLATKVSEIAILRTIFVSERLVAPPIVDKSLHEELKVNTELLTLVQEFAKPLLRYTDKLMEKYHHSKDILSISSGELALAKDSMFRVVTELEGADFGDGSEAQLTSLKSLLSQHEEVKMCEVCTLTPVDVVLECSHAVCSRCVLSALPEDWVNVRGELKVEVACPVQRCRGQVTVKDIKRVNEEVYTRKLRETEDKCKLRLCPECNQLHTVLAYLELKCNHQVCKYCLSTKYTIEYVCPVCKRGAYPSDFSPDTLKSNCYQCGKEFFYKQTYGYCCVIPYGADFYTEHGELCSDCLFTNYKSRRCLCHESEVNLTEENLAALGGNLHIMANCHKQPVPVKDIILQTTCNCVVCKECFEQRKGASNACPLCYTMLNEEAYSTIAPCSICGNPLSDIKLPCGHYLHSVCVGFLIQNGKSSNHAKCFACNHYIPPGEILQKIQGQPELFAAFNDAFGYAFDFKCTKPGGRMKHMQISDNRGFWYTCECHGQMVCPYCQAAYTSDSSHNCLYVSLRSSVDGMMAMEREVMQCPYCKYPEEFQESEYHQCERCKAQYVPCCCQSAEAVFYHGAAYHRPNCTKYNSTDYRPENPECPACKRTRKPCQTAKALQRPRLVGPGEALS